MSDARVQTDRLDHGVAALRLARAPVNALNPAFLNDIDTALAALGSDASVRAVVLAGEGKVLSAGMDLKELQSFSVADQQAMVGALNRTFTALYRFPKAVICAAHGAAIAGGLFFVLVSDYRVAGERAQFALAEMRVGVRFPIAPFEIARSELSAAACRRFMLSGAHHDAHTAKALGVVDEVVATEDVFARSLAVAQSYAALPAQTYAHTKHALRADVLARIDAVQAANADPLATVWFSEETLTATRAVLASLAKS